MITKMEARERIYKTFHLLYSFSFLFSFTKTIKSFLNFCHCSVSSCTESLCVIRLTRTTKIENQSFNPSFRARSEAAFRLAPKKLGEGDEEHAVVVTVDWCGCMLSGVGGWERI